MLSYFLLSATAIAFAFLDIQRKRLATHMSPTALVALLSLGSAPVFIVLACLKGFEMQSNYLSIGALLLALQLAANLLFVKALSVSDLSKTIPFLSLTPVFTAGTGAVTLGEYPNSAQIAGMVAVTAGAIFLGYRKAPAQGRGLHFEQGSLIMCAVAALWATTAALDKLALAYTNVPTHAAIQSTSMGLFFVAYQFLKNRQAELLPPRSLRPHAAFAILAAAAAMFLQLQTMTLVMVSLVETVKRATGALSSLLVGRIAFQEEITAQKVFSIALMSLGTALVLLCKTS